MKLLFIRHGDPDYELDDLTSVGRREAELLSERIAPMEIKEYYVSPRGRARATAAPTLAKAGRTASERDWLREFSIPVQRPDKGGALSAVPWDWLPQDWTKDLRFYDPIRWRENEIFQAAGVGEAYDRVCAALDALLAEQGYARDGLVYRAERPNERTLAFFCHFGVSCVFLSHLLHASPMVLWHGLCMAPSSVTTVYTEERRPGGASFRAAAVGDVSHLLTAGVEPSFSARFCEVYDNGDRVD